MTVTLGPRSRRYLLEKRRFPAEVEAALEDFEQEFGTLTSDIRDRLADGIIARDINETGDIEAAVRRIVSEDRDEIAAVFAEGAREGADAGRRMAARRFGLDIDLDLPPESALENVDEFADDLVDDVIDTIGEDVGHRIAGWLEDGVGVDDIADRLQDQLDNELGDAAAQRHARTLVMGASERGNESAIRESGAVGKRWVSTSDGRTRETHVEAEGQIVPHDGTFLVGDAEMRHPADPTAAVEEVVNCRCTTVPVFEDELTQDELARLRAGRRLNV